MILYQFSKYPKLTKKCHSIKSKANQINKRLYSKYYLVLTTELIQSTKALNLTYTEGAPTWPQGLAPQIATPTTVPFCVSGPPSSPLHMEISLSNGPVQMFRSLLISCAASLANTFRASPHSRNYIKWVILRWVSFLYKNNT